jgi:hypothetical protein
MGGANDRESDPDISSVSSGSPSSFEVVPPPLLGTIAISLNRRQIVLPA